jgi:hypothetical protein
MKTIETYSNLLKMLLAYYSKKFPYYSITFFNKVILQRDTDTSLLLLIIQDDTILPKLYAGSTKQHQAEGLRIGVTVGAEKHDIKMFQNINSVTWPAFQMQRSWNLRFKSMHLNAAVSETNTWVSDSYKTFP